jgi:hypothetical protein
MKFVRNKISVVNTIVNALFVRDQTVIVVSFLKSANIEDAVDSESKDFSEFTFDKLDAIAPENRGVVPMLMNPEMQKLYSHETIGAGAPGYYHCASILKWTKSDPKNKSLFDTKGPQEWIFEFRNNYYTRAYNKYPFTSVAREVGSSHFLKERATTPLTILFPFTTSTMEDAVFMLNCETSFPENPEIVVEEWTEEVAKFVPIPKIVMSSNTVSSGNVVSGTIEVVDYKGDPMSNANGNEVFLEVTAGALNKTRYLIGSDGSFKVRATDLDAGDTIRIKAGWRSYSGLAEVGVS